MAATPRYTTRLDLPHLIELGQATVLVCPVYSSGALVSPSAGTITITDGANTAVVSAAAVTITGGIAQYTVLGAVTSALSPSSSWRVLWSLTLPDGTVFVHRSEAFLVRYRLYPTISDQDVVRRIPALSTTAASRPTTVSTYQGFIEEADTIIQQALIAAGRRPWLVMSPSALRESWLTLTIAMIFDSLSAVAAPGDPWTERATHWRGLYTAAWAAASTTMDWDQDGFADSTERLAAKPSGFWLC